MTGLDDDNIAAFLCTGSLIDARNRPGSIPEVLSLQQSRADSLHTDIVIGTLDRIIVEVLEGTFVRIFEDVVIGHLGGVGVRERVDAIWRRYDYSRKRRLSIVIAGHKASHPISHLADHGSNGSTAASANATCSKYCAFASPNGAQRDCELRCMICKSV
jgi:hypothetical protein